jgi:pyridoxamine--pyruvate transaminase
VSTVFTLGTGPVEIYPAVREAFTRPILSDGDPEFLALYERVNEKVTRALHSATPAVLLQSEAILGIEAAAASLIGPDDVVLNLASGLFGKGFGYWAKRYNKELLEIEVPYDQAIDPQAVRDRFRERPDIKVVSAVHHETPTGTINPVAEIGRIVRDHDALMIVDAVSSFGGMNVHPEDICADIFVAGPGKCLGGAPGLTFLAVSERAWQHMDANPKAPFASILSIKDWRHAYRADRPFPFTPLMAEINALDATMDLYFAEGPERVWARHAATARACRAGAEAMGLKLWPASDAIASPTTTAIRLPPGIGGEALIEEVRSRYGVMLSGGIGDLRDSLIRIGHMGPTAHPMCAVVALTALGGALRALGVDADMGGGIEAALAAAERVNDWHRPE